MKEFCDSVDKDPNGIEMRLVHAGFSGSDSIAEWHRRNKEMIEMKLIEPGSHLQQGIGKIDYEDGVIIIWQTPLLYPSKGLIREQPEYTGPITGNLANCFDSENQLFLFQIRGNSVDEPWKFQAAAAGMGVYGQLPAHTATLEMMQETGLEHFENYDYQGTNSVLPFMKGGEGGVPQLLFSFGYLDNLTRFPIMSSIREIEKFEASLKGIHETGYLRKREGYHFAVPVANIEEITSALEGDGDNSRFHGPIYESTQNFISALKRYSIMK